MISYNNNWNIFRFIYDVIYDVTYDIINDIIICPHYICLAAADPPPDRGPREPFLDCQVSMTRPVLTVT